MSSHNDSIVGSLSPEVSIEQLIEEKAALQAQNAQLWRLVDKQRTMIQGLQKDLSRATTALKADKTRSSNDAHQPADVPYPTTPKRGDVVQRMPTAPEVIDDCDDTSTTTDRSPETFASPPASTSRRQPRAPPRPLDFGSSKGSIAVGPGEDLPIKSPLRSASTGQIYSLNSYRDNALGGDGSSTPMSPVLSLRMQQITRTASPLTQGFQTGRSGVEEIERVNMPRRERVRTSSQRSVSQVPSPRLTSGAFDEPEKFDSGTVLQIEKVEDLTDKEVQKSYFAELEIASLAPTEHAATMGLNRAANTGTGESDVKETFPENNLQAVAPEMVRSDSGGALMHIAGPYYAESTTFLPLTADKQQHSTTSVNQAIARPAAFRHIHPNQSPKSAYDQIDDQARPKTPEHIREPAMALEPAVEFFSTPARTIWQEQSPERERQGSIVSVMTDSTMPMRSATRSSIESSEHILITPADIGSVEIHMLPSSISGTLDLGIFDHDMILRQKIRRSYSNLLDLQRVVHINVVPELPSREHLQADMASSKSSYQGQVDQWFQTLQMQIAITQDQHAASSLSEFLTPDLSSSSDYHGSTGHRQSESVSRSDSAVSTRYADAPTVSAIVSKEGYLRKRGKNFGGWKSRFFVLNGPLLRYYESPGGPQLGSIQLPQAQIGSQQSTVDGSSNTSEKDHSGPQHAFMILEPKKRNANSFVRHVLCANSDSDRDEWIRTLMAYVHNDKSSISPDTLASDSRRSLRSTNNASSSTPTQGIPYEMHGPSPQVPSSARFTAIGYDETAPGKQPQFTSVNESSIRNLPESFTARSTDPDGTPVAISRPMNGAPIENNSAWGATSMTTPSALPPATTQAEKKAKKKSFWTFGKSDHSHTSSTREVSSVKSPSSQDLSFGSQNGSNLGTGAFGMPLVDAVQISRDRGVNAGVPIVVSRCIDYLEVKHAEREEGIYRLSGSNTVIKGLKERFNTEIDINLVACGEYFDIHAIAGLLKLYLRDLPSSILTRELQRDFLDIIEMPEGLARMVTVRTLVHSLPKENFELLKILSRHLGAIVSHSDMNKMTLRNVGIVFSPTLNIPAAVFSLFIAEYDLIFNDRDDASRMLSQRPVADSNSIRSTRSNNPTASVYLDTEQSYDLLQHSYGMTTDDQQPYGISEYRPSNLSHQPHGNKTVQYSNEI